ncbi:class I SAM-dependent methyltransferase [Actinoplanes sp. NPDC049802]|uniref:class I SAM-dependent methyltransferase n=1 Tax=Actinoplanes sp. NPDC049802 TaxID=3154742 RepID=UPI00341151FB
MDEWTPAIIFNSGVLAHAIAAADQFGVFEELDRADSLNMRLQDYAEQDRSFVRHTLELLAIVEVVIEVDTDVWTKGAMFDQYAAMKGFFSWLFAGSGAALVYAAHPAKSSRGTDPVRRESGIIARSTGDFGKAMLDPVVASFPEVAGANKVADLGCGDASRLIHIRRECGAAGLGVDLSSEAVERARANILSTGYRQEIEVTVADVRVLSRTTLDPDVDTVTCCLMGHDLWPRPTCVSSLREIRAAFPNADRLVLLETVRAETAKRVTDGIPSLGYEYLHEAMGQYIPGLDEWLEVLPDGGWRVDRVVPVSVPSSTYAFICMRLEI